METKLFNGNDFKIEYLEWGNGETIFVFPGGGTHLKEFVEFKWAKELSRKFKLFVFHLPGMGVSEFYGKFCSLDIMSDIILEFIKQQKIEKLNLIGHSGGGNLCFELAKKYPNIDKIVLLSAGEYFYFLEKVLLTIIFFPGYFGKFFRRLYSIILNSMFFNFVYSQKRTDVQLRNLLDRCIEGIWWKLDNFEFNGKIFFIKAKNDIFLNINPKFMKKLKLDRFIEFNSTHTEVDNDLDSALTWEITNFIER